MLCPVCKVELKISDREGIEIDYCPKCRGVWLDRSELDQIIKRSTSRNDRYDEYDEDGDSESRGRNQRGRGRDRDNDGDDEEGGFLGNLFGGFGGRDD